MHADALEVQLAPHEVQKLADEFMDVQIDANWSGRRAGQIKAALDGAFAAVDLRLDLIEGAPDLFRIRLRLSALIPDLPQPLRGAVNIGQAVRNILERSLGESGG